MRRMQVPGRPPDLEWEAQILKGESVLGTGLCRIWTPATFADRSIVEFEIGNRDIALHGPRFTVKAERPLPDGGVDYFLAEDVWFTFIPRPDPRIPSRRAPTAVGTPEYLVVGHRYGQARNQDAARLPHVTFFISDNALLEPARILEKHFLLGLSAETIHAFDVEWTEGHHFRFERHFAFGEGAGPDATEIKSHLVATTHARLEGGLRHSVTETVLPALRDVLRIASFAARMDTRAFRWQAATDAEHIEVYLGNVSPMRPRDNEGAHDTLIDKSKFDEFIRTAMHALRNPEQARVELLRLALIKATHRVGETAESRYLSLFSALESVLLLYRRQASLEFTTDNDAWKKLKKALQQCIDANAALFLTDFHRRSAAQSMLALRRIPVASVFFKFAEVQGVKYDDLWPVFDNDGAPSLAHIRNCLAHGEAMGDERFGAFVTALHHLEVLVERICLALLGWDWQKSEVGERLLRSRVGFDTASIAAGMAAWADEPFD